MARLGRICVYCGSSPGVREEYRRTASALGTILVERGMGLVYGGSNRGLMGTLADAVLGAGGEVIGVIPYGLVHLEAAHRNLTELHRVETLHQRKSQMLSLCDGLITLPGGFGSHDELFEALSWLQLGIHDKPVGLLNVGGYFDGLLDHLDRASAEGFIAPAHRSMLLVDEDPQALLDRFEHFEPPERPPWRSGA